MKSFGCLFFAVFMLSVASTADSQNVRRDGLYDRLSTQKQRNDHDLDSRHRALSALENEAENRTAPPDAITARRLEIDRNITQMNEDSNALIKAVDSPDEKSWKESAKFAERIAKCSKQIRQNINSGKSVCKIEPSEPPASNDRVACIKKLAENIDGLINEVVKSRYEIGLTVDAGESGSIIKQLESIEGQALCLREIMKRK